MIKRVAFRFKLTEKPLAAVLLLLVKLILLLVMIVPFMPLLQRKQAFLYPIKPVSTVQPITVSNHGINLNTATFSELISLPGIGEKTAEEIIAFRHERGCFYYVEDLLGVRGIGESKLNALRDWVYVE